MRSAEVGYLHVSSVGETKVAWDRGRVGVRVRVRDRVIGFGVRIR